MNYFVKSNGSLICRDNGETIMITPWGKNSVRVRASILSDITDDPAALLEQECTTLGEICISEKEAIVCNGKITVKVTVEERIAPWSSPLKITYYNQNGKVLLEEINNGGALVLSARKFKALPGGLFSLKATFISDPQEKIYGMGQYQQELLNLKGANLELAQRNSQATVPFYVSDKGYGFLWNNASIGDVHFGINTTQWEASACKQLDYWVTAGDTPAEIMEAYACATGKAPMMPEYGLGFWQCKLRYYSQEEVLNVCREYKKRGIPLDVFVIDYYHWPRCGDWRFDEEYFPDPEAMVKELKEMGIETMVSVWPAVDWRSENYEEMKNQGLLVKVNGGIDVQMSFHGNNAFMDATNPRTREYVWEKCKQNYADMGIKTYWLDVAEPEYSTYDYETYRYHAGLVAEKGNIYPREYARLFYEGQKANGQDDIVNLIRCAWAGSQRYAALVWSGDIMSTYEDFRKQLCAGIHMGLSGIPWWTTDIGGFHQGATADPWFHTLLTRWFQFGTFCPVMRLHGRREPFVDIYNAAGELREGTGADNEIWSFGEDTYEILVKFIKIREKMRDYTRTLMTEAHETGAPVMRAMFYEFPQDKKCWEIQDAYMYGSDILVAPICYDGAVEREVYLPEGAEWVHAGTGKKYEGGQTVLVEAPIDTLPIFLRDGKQDYLIGEI